MSRPLTESEKEWLQEVGLRLRLRRTAFRKTQRELAEVAGVSTFTISHIETGAHLGAVLTLARLCRALDWSLTELLGDLP